MAKINENVRPSATKSQAAGADARPARGLKIRAELTAGNGCPAGTHLLACGHCH